MYRITDTRADQVVNRKDIEKARMVAYDAMYRMMEAAARLDTKLAWEHFRAIHNWDGIKHVTLRSGIDFVTLEKLA